MDPIQKNESSNQMANALLEKLRADLEQNAADRESVLQEAEKHKYPQKRYTFRTMKRSDYLEKKRIAEELARAADDAEISDDDLEALLRAYLTTSDKAEAAPVAGETAAPATNAPAAAEPVSVTVPDPDLPLTGEDAPFFEELALEMDLETEDAYVAVTEEPEEIAETQEAVSEDPLSFLADTEDADFFDALLAEVQAETTPETAQENETKEQVLPTTTDAEAIPTPAVQEEAKENASPVDSDLEALLASLPDDALDAIAAETAPLSYAEHTEDTDITDLDAQDTDDSLLDDILSAVAESDEKVAPPTEDTVSPHDLDALLGADSDTPPDFSDEDLFALLDEIDPATEEADPISREETATDMPLHSPDDPLVPDETEDTGALDQTDLDLMIAFGMEDQLEKAVGPEAAMEYKRAMGERKDGHIREMHHDDRPDTALDRHAEYVSPAQNKEIFAEYKKQYTSILTRFVGAVFFLLLLFFFENNNLLGIKLPSLLDREMYPFVYTLFDLQLVLLSGAMVFKSIKVGIRGIFRGKPTPESILGFSFLACFVYTAVILSLCPMHDLQLYNFPLALSVLFALIYEYMNLRREIMSFKIISSKKLKYAVDAISPKDSQAEIRMFADYISDDPALFRIKRTAFVEDYFRRTETYPRTQRILRAVLPATLLLMLGFFASSFMLGGDMYTAINVGYITMLLALPSYAFVSFGYPMYRASRLAYDKDSAMIGEASLGEYADASVVSFDDKEVFPPHNVRVRNVKVYGNNRIDHLIYAAASVFHVVGGPLSEVFETATGELGWSDNVQLTQVASEGIEARVDGGAVLIGRAPFINGYGYSIELSESERTMEETGDASILYIAYDNNVAAKLYIQYAVEPDFEVVLKQLYRQGVCIGIKTSDPCIDDHLLSCKIKMSKYPVKIIKCAEPRETAITVDRLSSGIVSKASAKSLLQTLAMCDRVLSTSRTGNVIGVVSMLLAMAAMAFVVLSGMPLTAAPIWFALYQLFWVVPAIAVARYQI